MTIIDTPEGMLMVGLLQHAHRLALEINTGMGFRQSSLAILRRLDVTLDGGATYRPVTIKGTKKGALKDLVKLIKEINPDYTESDSIAKAMAK